MNKRHAYFVLLVFFALFSSGLMGQVSDTLVMDNGNMLIGELKVMNKGVVTLKTKYSENDFKIKWDHIKYLKTNRFFVIYLVQGTHYFGRLSPDLSQPDHFLIFDFQKGRVSVKKEDIIYLKNAEKTFWGRINFDVSLGYSLTKANNNSQMTTLFNAAYLANSYRIHLNYDMNRNFQTIDDTLKTKTKRTELSLGGQYFLKKRWFLSGAGTFLNSSEQKLSLRSNISAGAGNFLINNHVHYLSVSGGLVWNLEKYYPETGQPEKNSLESFFGVEYVVFNFGKLDINTSLYAYPSLTEKKRFRSDFNFSLKYKFISNFFINLSFNYNFDNQPAEGASRFDYVFQTTIGWKFNE